MAPFTMVGYNIKRVLLESRVGFQCEIYIVPPFTTIPAHSHNNVRNNIVFLNGLMVFEKSGNSLELISPQDSGRGFIIDPGEMHSAFTKGQWGIFMTEQYWLDNEPVIPLHLNWQNGRPIDDQHEKQLIEAK